MTGTMLVVVSMVVVGFTIVGDLSRHDEKGTWGFAEMV